MRTVLSVDVAKNKSMIMLMNSNGEVLIDLKEIKHNLEDFEKVKEEIKEINSENLTIFMESTGTYHLAVKRYFKEKGFNTLVINSLTTKNNLVLAHLLLGEATKFGNSFKDLLHNLLKINSDYFVIYKYMEDYIMCSKFDIIKKLVFNKQKKQVFSSFIGKNYIVYLIKDKEYKS